MRTLNDINLVSGQHVDVTDTDFEFIMREYGTKVLRLVYLFVKDRNLAEDITQDVFIKVYRNLPNFRGESALHTWIYRIAANESKSYLRSWSFRNVFPISQVNKNSESTVEMEALEQINQQNIAELVMQLPSNYRQVIVLHYYEDLQTTEIAEILGLSEGTVRTRLHRARKQLQHLLEKEELV